MIYDSVENLDKYQGIHPNLKVVIDFLKETDLSQLTLGRNEILGDQVFLMVQENQPNDIFSGEYEYHKKYLDLHITVVGEEIIAYGYGDKKEVKVYDSKDDYGLVTCHNKQELLIPENRFVLFLPDEAHEPNKKVRNSSEIKKYVVKIAV